MNPNLKTLYLNKERHGLLSDWTKISTLITQRKREYGIERWVEEHYLVSIIWRAKFKISNNIGVYYQRRVRHMKLFADDHWTNRGIFFVPLLISLLKLSAFIRKNLERVGGGKWLIWSNWFFELVQEKIASIYVIIYHLTKRKPAITIWR